jgi:hypothetical protein
MATIKEDDQEDNETERTSRVDEPKKIDTRTKMTLVEYKAKIPDHPRPKKKRLYRGLGKKS